MPIPPHPTPGRLKSRALVCLHGARFYAWREDENPFTSKQPAQLQAAHAGPRRTDCGPCLPQEKNKGGLSSSQGRPQRAKPPYSKAPANYSPPALRGADGPSGRSPVRKGPQPQDQTQQQQQQRVEPRRVGGPRPMLASGACVSMHKRP